MTRVRTAVFPVGGLGTRFLPATKSMPKEMLTVVDKPLIQYAFEEAQQAGIEYFIFITGRNKNIISNHFDHAYELQKKLDEDEKQHLLAQVKDWLPPAGSVAFIRQQQPLGLGHAVYCARHFVNEPFAVILADELFASAGKPLLTEMVETYEKTQGNIIGVAEIDPKDSHKYGMISSADYKNNPIEINGMVEKPNPKDAPSNLSITGRYIIQPEIFSYLEKTQQGQGGEIQLTDALQAMLETTPTYGVRFEGRRFDCGNRRGFLEANIGMALAREDIRDDIMDILKSFTG